MSARTVFMPYRNIPVLLYHQIAETTPEDDRLRLGVSPREFNAQMAYLHQNGYRTIDLDEHVSAFEEQSSLDKVFAVTFDDGYLDNYTDALPILKKYGFTATIFIVSGFVGKSHAWHGCTPVKYMNWGQAREMLDLGISFGSHTHTHPDLTKLSADRLAREIVYSQKTIEDKLGIPVRTFSYPFGRYNTDVIDAVVNCGMESAYSVSATEWHRYTLERFMITSRDTTSLFRLKACERASWIRGMYKCVGGMLR